MKVFVSWSGLYSRNVAELLRDWVPNVLQEAELYVSSQDIAKGDAWPDNVRANLAEIDLGLVIVTRSNLAAPWIMFEAGALSKAVKSRMIPVLCGVEPVDLAKSPLRLFQAATVEEQDMRAVLSSLNSNASTPLDPERVDRAFTKWWPEFFEAYSKLEEDAPPVETRVSKGDKQVLDALSAILADLNALKAEVRKPRHNPANQVVPTELDERYRNLIPNISNAELVAAVNKLKKHSNIARDPAGIFTVSAFQDKVNIEPPAD